MNFTMSPRWVGSLLRCTAILAGVVGLGIPQVVAQGVTETVVAGANVTLMASADGNPAPTFQWRKNGTAISGATQAVLTLASVTTADAGTYTVLATNSVGSALSDELILVVNAAPPPQPPPSNPNPTPTNIAPTIETQPIASQTVLTGANVTLAVGASGSPAPSYQWRRNGVAISGATGSSLTFSSIALEHAGSYTVLVSNVAGSITSNVSELVVHRPPAITTQPVASLTATTGGSVSLSVGAAGYPSPTYQWRKNGQAISGATSATLTLSGLTTGDSGVYTVAVSNVAGSISSNSATLTVSAPPVVPPPPVNPPPVAPPPVNPPVVEDEAPAIAVQPVSNQIVVAGSAVSLSVSATGAPSPTYQWRKNGQAISGATSSTLNFAKIGSGDSATYSVTVSNRLGSVTSTNAAISVNVAPAFTIQPASQAVFASTAVTLSVGVAGIPGPTLQWRRDGVVLPGATSAVLRLDNFSANDEGIYSVVATNAAGSVISHNAHVVIGASPRITRHPANQTVGENSTATFSAAASGTPIPGFQWKRDGVNIEGATSNTLVLKSVGKSDAGVYSVEARNDVGWVVSNGATLSVNAANQSNPGSGGSGNEPPGTAGSGTSSGSRVVNLSVRSQAGTGSNALIVGLVVSSGGSKSLLLRGIGPTLGAFGVTGYLSDPTLSVYSGATLRASNDDWNGNDNAPQIVGTSIQVGAFALPDSARDAALMTTLDGGAYTVQVSGKQAASGMALVEVYDAAAASAARLVNLSVRTHVGTGDNAPNIGFVISGTTAKRVLLRAIGPALANFGVTSVLADPQIEIYRDGVSIHRNDNWGGGSELNTTFAQVGAFALENGGSKDAALLVTLEPGAYTAVVSGVGNTTGVALVELYDVP